MLTKQKKTGFIEILLLTYVKFTGPSHNVGDFSPQFLDLRVVAGDGQIAARIQQRPLAHQVDHAAVVRLRAVHESADAAALLPHASAAASAVRLRRLIHFTLYEYFERIHCANTRHAAMKARDEHADAHTGRQTRAAGSERAKEATFVSPAPVVAGTCARSAREEAREKARAQTRPAVLRPLFIKVPSPKSPRFGYRFSSDGPQRSLVV